jgi:hypothetical protein
MHHLSRLALLAIAATLAATPALAGRRHWDDRPGRAIGANGYHPGGFARGPGFRPGVPVYGGYGRPRAVPVYGGYYPPARAFRPGYYAAPVYAAPVYVAPPFGVRRGWGGPPVVYGGYGGYPVPVPVPVAYGGYPAQGGFYDPCRSTGTGAVIGAIAGGLIGNGIAGRYDRGLGTVVGAGLGAVTGTAIERSQRCGY